MKPFGCLSEASWWSQSLYLLPCACIYLFFATTQVSHRVRGATQITFSRPLQRKILRWLPAACGWLASFSIISFIVVSFSVVPNRLYPVRPTANSDVAGRLWLAAGRLWLAGRCLRLLGHVHYHCHPVPRHSRLHGGRSPSLDPTLAASHHAKAFC